LLISLAWFYWLLILCEITIVKKAVAGLGFLRLYEQSAMTMGSLQLTFAQQRQSSWWKIGKHSVLFLHNDVGDDLVAC
jgi:hypothetical protein